MTIQSQRPSGRRCGMHVGMTSTAIDLRRNARRMKYLIDMASRPMLLEDLNPILYLFYRMKDIFFNKLEGTANTRSFGPMYDMPELQG